MRAGWFCVQNANPAMDPSSWAVVAEVEPEKQMAPAALHSGLNIFVVRADVSNVRGGLQSPEPQWSAVEQA
jgi:hypothetical protein